MATSNCRVTPHSASVQLLDGHGVHTHTYSTDTINLQGPEILRITRQMCIFLYLLFWPTISVKINRHKKMDCLKIEQLFVQCNCVQLKNDRRVEKN